MLLKIHSPFPLVLWSQQALFLLLSKNEKQKMLVIKMSNVSGSAWSHFGQTTEPGVTHFTSLNNKSYYSYVSFYRSFTTLVCMCGPFTVLNSIVPLPFCTWMSIYWQIAFLSHNFELENDVMKTPKDQSFLSLTFACLTKHWNTESLSDR